MVNQVMCAKLNKLGEALEKPPFPGEFGQRIHQQVCKEAWGLWVSHQTMLINEYRLSMIEPKAREFIKQEMEKFFFGQGSTTPEGFTPE